MATQERRTRERADRERAIITAARELAESAGWDAVTTRRLADRIEYSQPVLYSHFAGKDAIMAAVALEGFAELATAIRSAAQSQEPRLLAVARAYLGFADASPALYDAMFTMATELPFAQQHTPGPLREAFASIRDTLAPLARDRDPDILAELYWSALHGVATLTRGGRLPRETAAQRVTLLVELFTG